MGKTRACECVERLGNEPIAIGLPNRPYHLLSLLQPQVLDSPVANFFSHIEINSAAFRALPLFCDKIYIRILAWLGPTASYKFCSKKCDVECRRREPQKCSSKLFSLKMAIKHNILPTFLFFDRRSMCRNQSPRKRWLCRRVLRNVPRSECCAEAPVPWCRIRD